MIKFFSDAMNRAARAYEAGHEANNNEIDIGDNPYRIGSFQWLEWLNGWLDCDAETKGFDMNSWLELISECELCRGTGKSQGLPVANACEACDGAGVIRNPLSIAELARLITNEQAQEGAE